MHALFKFTAKVQSEASQDLQALFEHNYFYHQYCFEVQFWRA